MWPDEMTNVEMQMTNKIVCGKMFWRRQKSDDFTAEDAEAGGGRADIWMQLVNLPVVG
jgi:hypothetical protein